MALLGRRDWLVAVCSIAVGGAATRAPSRYPRPRPRVLRRPTGGINRAHFFHGEVRRTRHGALYACGYHHEGVAPPTVRLVSGSVRRWTNGVYEARIEILHGGTWLRKQAPSTFFPRHWTPSRVEYEVLEAFRTRNASLDVSRGGALIFRSTTISGLEIQGVVKRGVIDTAYPLAPTSPPLRRLTP